MASDVNITRIKFNPLGAHGRQTNLTSAFAPAAPPGASTCVVQALTQNVRFTLDGTTPTAVVGFQIVAGDVERILPVDTRTVLTFIQETAGAELQYQFGD
jgi:hypothetical protein